MRSEVISQDPERMSGTPTFKGTRVPVNNLFDYLENGDSIEEFLSDFPTVSRNQVQEVLKTARKRIA